jgi:hypothetical protein
MSGRLRRCRGRGPRDEAAIEASPVARIDPVPSRSFLLMGKRSRRHSTTGAVARERMLLDAIADGQLDDHLTALADAVDARRRLLHTVRSATALATLCVGDHVRITHDVSPRYLAGLQGTIVDVDDHTATILLPQAVGRFSTGQVRCPPLALEKLSRAAS